MIRCRDWTAIHDHMPPGPKSLAVRGVCEFPSGGYTVELQRQAPQGINPLDLLLNLVIQEPEIGTGMVTEIEVDYREDTETEHDTVTIRADETVSGGAGTITVQHVH